MKRQEFKSIIKKIVKNKIITIVILCVLSIVIFFCLFSILHNYNNRNRADKIYEEIKNNVEITIQSDESKEVQKKSINFDALWAINKDVYAYIEIPGTDISYPILQSKNDNSYYLNNTIEGINGLPGSIYTENYNTKDFADRNTVIYGHNMKNGSMFAQLYNYSDTKFFNENPYVYIYLPDKVLKYQIFAAVIFDDRHILGNFDFTKAQRFNEYLSEIYSLKNPLCQYNNSIKVNESDKIITLSTCMPNDMPNNRWLVEAVLIDE